MNTAELIKLARIRHWVKNIVILIPLLFSKELLSLQSIISAFAVLLGFCLLSSAVYIFNDITDRDRDRSHPVKKNRPIAAGEIAPLNAAVYSAIIMLIGLLITALVSLPALVIALAYVMLQFAYSLILKQLVLIDVIAISLGFVIRALAGVAAVNVELSPWLFICLFTLCLFMGFCKRCNEIVTINAAGQGTNQTPDRSTPAYHTHRSTLIEYTTPLLTHLITLSAAVAVVAFLLYSLSATTVLRFGTNYFVYTLPVVVYGVFRFAMLSMKGTYLDPTDLILRDRPFQLTVIIWTVLAAVIIFTGPDIANAFN
jgi:4-hydroxybenzoate polyprenyltransferase